MANKKTSNQDRRKLPGWNPNPKGNGGFQDHPELRSNGRWDKNNSQSYWLNYFSSLPMKEFKEYKSIHPEMTMAAHAAYERILRSPDKLDEYREVANRTEGMPKQSLDMTSNGQNLTAVEVTIVHGKAADQGDNSTIQKP